MLATLFIFLTKANGDLILAAKLDIKQDCNSIRTLADSSINQLWHSSMTTPDGETIGTIIVTAWTETRQSDSSSINGHD